jgi:hypothetical protein
MGPFFLVNDYWTAHELNAIDARIEVIEGLG